MLYAGHHQGLVFVDYRPLDQITQKLEGFRPLARPHRFRFAGSRGPDRGCISRIREGIVEPVYDTEPSSECHVVDRNRWFESSPSAVPNDFIHLLQYLILMLYANPWQFRF
jgi:hypothetical protein